MFNMSNVCVCVISTMHAAKSMGGFERAAADGIVIVGGFFLIWKCYFIGSFILQLAYGKVSLDCGYLKS